MANDDLVFCDIDMAVAEGAVNRKLTRDPRGTRYEVVGPVTDGRIVGIICRFKSTGKLLMITVYSMGKAP